MRRAAFLIVLLALTLSAAPAQAQVLDDQFFRQNELPPAQSLKPTQTPCGPGSQSVRVCNDDFRSCNSVCTATALDPSADIAGCSLRCCTQFKACLSIRGCASRTINCF
jgi:hypothetical protein